MSGPFRLLVVAALAVAAVAGPAVPAQASPAAQRFTSCAAVHRAYSGGIAKQGVRSNTVHSHGRVQHRALKGRVKVSTALYAANRRLDRDRDGIACERS